MRVYPNDLNDIYLQGGVRVPAFLHGPPLAQAIFLKDFSGRKWNLPQWGRLQFFPIVGKIALSPMGWGGPETQ